MSGFVTVGDEAEAFGHPSECAEPASGLVESSDNSSLTFTDSTGESRQIAAVGSAVITFPEHGHDTDDDDNCTDFQSHEVTPDEVLTSVSLNGQALYKSGDNVATDPVSGGNINIL